MLVTVIADASYCHKDKVAGYGFWIACGRGKQGGGDIVDAPIVSSVHAEMEAIVRALEQGLKQELISPFDVILIQSDCIAAMNTFRNGRRNIGEQESLTLERYLQTKQDFNLNIRFKHVRGHTRCNLNRSRANRHCDQRARNYLNKARLLKRTGELNLGESNMAIIEEQQVVVDQLDRIMNIYKASEGFIRPHFILTGPSGSGKSHVAQQLAGKHDIDFFEINAAQLTKEGTSGNSLAKALSVLTHKTNNLVICFVDEFDKLFISGNNNDQLAHETTNGVQNEFLKVLESKTTSVFGDYGKYNEVAVDKVLFIFAGAFNGEDNLTIDRLRQFNIKTEFLGRVGLIYNLKKLSVHSMYHALVNSALLANYLMLFPDCKKDDVVRDIMRVVERNHEKNTLGIRMLNTLLNQYFINNGKLDDAVAQQSTFQTTLSFEANPNGTVV